MSKQDDHFFNVFSAVIGILVAITIGIIAFSRYLGGAEAAAHAAVDPLRRAEVAARIASPGQVAIAGQDNSALVVDPPPGSAAPVALELPADGAATYQAVCTACHGGGIGGAPKTGDPAAWAPRLAQGKDVLYKHAIEGFQGPAGLMPAKGGRADLTDDLVRQAVDHMLPK